MNARSGLECIAFFYPCYFVAASLLAVPALLRVAFLGHELKRLEVSYYGLFVAGGDTASWGGSFGDRLLVTVVYVGLLAIVVRQRRHVAGLAAALCGVLAIRSALIPVLFGQSTRIAQNGVALGLAVATLSLGFVWMLAGSYGRYWRRAVTLLATVVLPMAVLSWMLWRGWRSWRVVAIDLGSAAVMALAVSVAKPRNLPKMVSAKWSVVLAGLLLTVALAMGAPMAQKWVARERAAETRRALSALPKLAEDLPYSKLFFQRGVSLTAEAGVGYESPSARRMLDSLPDFGVNAVALIPFARTTWNPVRISLNNNPGTSWESDAGLEILSVQAHSRGMKVMLKPHVSRPREAQLPTAAERAEWFAQFGRFLEHYARLATRIHADLLCVGVEFGWLTRHEDEWRGVIERVRRIYPGPLVYAANFGAEFENIRFWDALDYIGLNNYYPLPGDLATDALVKTVEAVHTRFQKPVLFTEAGFASAVGAHREPWRDDSFGSLSLEEQARCYEAVLQAFYERPWFSGVYWWKVGANGYGGPNNASMTPWRKPAMDVLKRWYRNGTR